MSKGKIMEWVDYTKVNAKVTKAKEKIVAEYALSINVNGKYFNTAMITPMMQEEFIIGHLYGQGMITNTGDIKSIIVKDNKTDVILSRKRDQAKWSPQANLDFKVRREDIFSGVNAILKSKIYAETEAAHSAGLFKPGVEPVCVAEDIGRHNALDKVIGYALMHEIDLRKTFATSTGRMVFDMVSKVCRANIPIVATKTAVTKLGVEMGKRCRLTIIGFVRESDKNASMDADSKTGGQMEMKIYTYPQRIL